MTTRTHTFAAFALSLVVTLAIFSGVANLSAAEHGAPLLAQVQAGSTAAAART
jgi:hypothetical protein